MSKIKDMIRGFNCVSHSHTFALRGNYFGVKTYNRLTVVYPASKLHKMHKQFH